MQGPHYWTGLASELVGVRPERVRWWARTGVVRPSIRDTTTGGCLGVRAWSGTDLILLRVAHRLDVAGVAPRGLKAGVAALRSSLEIAGATDTRPLEPGWLIVAGDEAHIASGLRDLGAHLKSAPEVGAWAVVPLRDVVGDLERAWRAWRASRGDPR